MVSRFVLALAVALCTWGVLGAQTPPSPAPAADAPPVVPARPEPASGGTTWTTCCQPWDSAGMYSEHFWFNADYLLAWLRSTKLPPLITSSPPGTAQTAAGVLGQTGTSIVFGSIDVAGDTRSGVRFEMGGWLDADRSLGAEAGVFMLESQAAIASVNSTDDNAIIARPFVNATTGAQASQLVAFPGLATGTATASYRSDNFFGANVDFDEVFVCCNAFRLTGLLGYRFLEFNERLAVDTTQAAVGGPFVAGTQIQASDRFSARNTFHGADFGLRAQYVTDRWAAGCLVKLSLGNINRSTSITGATETTVPGSATTTDRGGLLALVSNSGVFGSDDWVLLPEVDLNFGWKLSEQWTLRLGYTFLMVPRVARAADLVDLTVNPNLIPPAQSNATPSRPAFGLQKTDIWLQAINAGVEYRF